MLTYFMFIYYNQIRQMINIYIYIAYSLFGRASACALFTSITVYYTHAVTLMQARI